MNKLFKAVLSAESLHAREKQREILFLQAYDTLCREMVAYLESRPGLVVQVIQYMGGYTFHVKVSTQIFTLALHRNTSSREVSLRVNSEEGRNSVQIGLKSCSQGGWRIVNINYNRPMYLLRRFRKEMLEDFMVYLV